MTLRAKLLMVFIGVTLFSSVLTLWLLRESTGEILIQNLAEKGLLEANLEASVTAGGFIAKSEKALLPRLVRLRSVTGAVHAMALDPTGRVLAHTEAAQKGAHYQDPFTMDLLKAQKPVARINPGDGKPLLEIAVPVWAATPADAGEQFLLDSKAPRERRISGNWIGIIRLALPLQESFNVQARIIRGLALTTLLVTLVGILATWGLVRGVLLPIGQLMKGTQRISEGNYGAEIPIGSKDELGKLARSFNHMSKVLSETTVSKDFLGKILSNMTDGLILVAADGTIQMVNQTTLRLLGYEEREIVGQPAALLTGDKDRLPEGTMQNVELELRTKFGAALPVLLSSAVLHDEGSFTGIIVTLKDMTERLRLEGAIRQSEKMAAVGQLAAGIAHEINNPLGVILGFAEEGASQLPANDPLEVPLRYIEKEALRCKNLVQDLLVFARASKMEGEPLDISPTVEGALSLAIPRARMVHVEIHKDLASGLPRVLGNPNQIQQVIINLANNALDAMGDAGGQLTFKTELAQEGTQSWVCLKVTDTGPGIPAEIQSRVFEPFFTTKGVGKGTGLGLSLVHEIVKKHSGKIELLSRPGRTEFCVKFPVP